ncbi:MAG: ATP-dependent helicase, partial [Nanoarchaeota archaeon]|nr:ATP-dependent helicase [Nanoarchaeota archaeon]
NHMDVLSWERDLKADFEIIGYLLNELNKITPQRDSKLNGLISLIENKIKNPINKNNKKVIVFSAFADTVHYLYEHISKYFKENYNLNSASISGSGSNKTTIKLKQNEMNHILTYFSPISKKRDLIGEGGAEIDILIATDCISEG